MKDQVSIPVAFQGRSYVGDDCSEQQLLDILDIKVKLLLGSLDSRVVSIHR